MNLNLRSVDLNLLPVFMAIMEAGQLSRAAEQLGMSQPAMSAAVQRLRHTLGDALFIRSRLGMIPTPRAHELHQQLLPHVTGLQHALSPERIFNPGDSDRQFNVLSGDYFEIVVLPVLLEQLRATAPSVVVGVQGIDQTMADSLHKTQSDLAIDVFAADDPRLTQHILSHEPLVVIARRGHPELKGRCGKQQFLNAEHVVLPERNHRLPLDQILNAPGWQRRIGARVTQLASMLAICAQSDMIATVPMTLAQRYAQALHLQVLPFPADLPPIPVFMIWAKSQQRDRGHQWFRQQILTLLGNDTAR